MRNKFIILICLIELTACRYPKISKSIKKEFKYNPNTFKINGNIIETKGFYRDVCFFDSIPNSQKLCGKSYHDIHDTSFRKNNAILDIIFFKNGICLMSSLDELEHGFDKPRRLELINDINKRDKSAFFYSGSSVYWGTYNTIKDTLKIKMIQRNNFIAGEPYAFEQWYKIINKNTLQPILFKALTKSDYIKDWNATVYLDPKYYPPSKFYPIKDSTLINPNYCWLLNKKWFWQNKEDYKEWKKSQGKN